MLRRSAQEGEKNQHVTSDERTVEKAAEEESPEKKSMVPPSTVQQTAEKRSGKALALLAYTIPLLILACTAAAFYYLELRSEQASAGAGEKVIPGRDYYVFVSLVELSEKNGKGAPWDEYPPSAPDIKVEIYWKNQIVYSSTTKDDTFLAKWSNASVDIIDLAIGGRDASVDSAIQAARINIAKGDSIEIRVFDVDLLGASDLAGSKMITSTELVPGDQVFAFPSGPIRRIKLRVLSMDEAPDILQ